MTLRQTLTASLSLSLILASGAPCVARGSSDGPGEGQDVRRIAEGSNAFAVDLYRLIALGHAGDGPRGASEGDDSASKNVFLSPLSIHTALAMTYAGARGRTAEEMEKVLHLPVADEEGWSAQRLHAALGRLVDQLNNEAFLKQWESMSPEQRKRAKQWGQDKPPFELSVANSLWGQQGYEFREPFLSLLKAHYGAGLRRVDYRGATEQARREINKWVEDRTKEKIKNLIPQGILSTDTRLVLANAVYFKSGWLDKFPERLTRDEPFHLSVDKKTDARMMHRTGDLPYHEGEGFHAVDLPFDRHALSMTILVPKAIDGLGKLEAALRWDQLSESLGQMRRRRVDLTLPKFKMTRNLKLRPVLEALGMPLAFSTAADFSGMTEQSALRISEVLHKAYVDCNEEGVEAAAATAVPMAEMTAVRREPEPVTVRADRPFLLLIRHRRSGTVLFMGRVSDPSAEE
jgi:serpin B